LSGGIKSEWKTKANLITLIRIILIPLFVVVLLAPWPEWFFDPTVSVQQYEFVSSAVQPWIAAAIYAALALTDGVDGYIARKNNEVTRLGKFLDPIADKLLVAAALLALIELGDLPSWVVLIIIAREFIVSGLRMIAASDGVVVAARMSGKVKTALTLVAILMFIIKRSSVVMALPEDIYTVIYVLSWAVMIAALIMTIVSMIQYFQQVFQIEDSTNAEGAVAGASNLEIINRTVEADDSAKADVIASADAVDGTEATGAVDSENTAGQDLSASIAEKAAEVLNRARELGVHIATAESCTGGLIGASITRVPGSSDSFDGGIISYSYDVKEAELGVSHDDLEEFGAVSEPVALQMADGARRNVLSGFDDDHALAVSVTGVAGPGASENKPAGTVWFGISGRGETEAHVMHFKGDRDQVREQTVMEALRMLSERLG
jgi:nicotinamide-nucleotide amidase